MQYQLVLKANDHDEARELANDFTGAEKIVSITELNDRWVVIVEVDFDPYGLAAWESALNTILNADYPLVWWSRVPYEGGA